MAITCRRFQSEEDYFKLREFLEESVSRSGSKYYFNLNDLDFYFDLYEDKEHMQSITEQLENLFLWVEDEKIIGGILLFNRIQLFLNPTKKKFFREMFKLVEGEVNKFIKEGNGANYVSDFSQCSWRPFEGDTDLENVLLEKGYSKSDEYWVLRDFDYSEPIKEKKLPEGYCVKTFSEIQEPSDMNKVINLYEEYLGMGFDEFTLRNVKIFGGYRDELDIIIMAPDHTPAALCSGRYDEKNKMATFEAVACFDDHCKKGVSTAMMVYALKAARDLGAEVSTVLTLCPEKYPAPNRLYESAGFKLVGNRCTWKKE